MSGPEFGPGGYLPPKASKRARKIVLREQMGWGWPLAAAVVAVLVAVAGGWYVITARTPPQDPYLRVGALSLVEPGGAEVLTAGPGGTAALVVRAGGTVRAFRPVPEGIVWCPASQRLETPDGAWAPDGRRVFGDAPSLTPYRSLVFDGTVYVDTVTQMPAPPPAPGGEPPACAVTSSSASSRKRSA